ADIIKKKLKDVIDRNSAVSVKFEIFTPTIPSAIHVRPNPMTNMASAHIGVIQQWLNNGQKETPEEIAHFLSTIAVHGPFYAAGLKK
ncbi:TetR-like C-terminal domain-containing protein, partial [Bacillus cereus]